MASPRGTKNTTSVMFEASQVVLERLGSLWERPKLSWRPPGTLPSGQKPPGVSQSTLQNTALSIQRTPGTLHDILPLVKSFLTAFRTLFCRPDNSDTLARSTSIRSVVHNQPLSDCASSLHVTSYRPLLPAWCWGSAMNCDLRSFWEICSTGAAATEFNHALLMQAASPNEMYMRSETRLCRKWMTRRGRDAAPSSMDLRTMHVDMTCAARVNAVVPLWRVPAGSLSCAPLV